MCAMVTIMLKMNINSMFEKANTEMRTTYAMMEIQGLQSLFLEKLLDYDICATKIINRKLYKCLRTVFPLVYFVGYSYSSRIGHKGEAIRVFCFASFCFVLLNEYRHLDI